MDLSGSRQILQPVRTSTIIASFALALFLDFLPWRDLRVVPDFVALVLVFWCVRLEFVASLGAPWRFSTDTPEALLEPLGWDVEVIDSAVIGNRHGRWPFPVFPRGT